MAFFDELSALATPTKKFCWHPLDRNKPQPVWLPQLIRLSHSICFDLRTVDATGVNTGYPGGMTWAQIAAWQTAYSAQCVVSMPPYHFGGYSNTDPTNTAQDAAHLALIQGYIDTVKAAVGGTISVRTIWLDTEVFDAVQNSNPDTGGRQAINTAMAHPTTGKFAKVYNTLKHVTNGWPSAVCGFYGMGSVKHAAAGTAITLPNAFSGASAPSPYPWGPDWGLHSWNVHYYDIGDVLADPNYTVGTVAPWLGDAIMPAMYYPMEFNTMRMINQFSHRYAEIISPGKPIIPFFAMGQSMVRDVNHWEGQLVGTSYPTSLSKMYGTMFGDNWYGSTEANAQRFWYNMSEVVTWPAPDASDANNVEAHYVAFIDGMVS